MPYTVFSSNKSLMNSLQRKVFYAIQGKITDTERTYAAIAAVSAWYLEEGLFGDAYFLDDRNPNPCPDFDEERKPIRQAIRNGRDLDSF